MTLAIVDHFRPPKWSSSRVFHLPLIHGDEGQVQPVFALEHALLVREFQQGWRAEWGADGEEGQGRLFRLSILAVEDFHPSSNVQSL